MEDGTSPSAADATAATCAYWSAHSNWYALLPTRYRVPTVELPLAHSQDATEASPFAKYLLSDDTRLPSHPLFRMTAPKDEDFDVLLTERDEARLQTADDTEALAAQEEPSVPPAPFTEEVAAVVRAIADLQDPTTRHEDADYGVVVGGAFGLADDANWSTLSGTVRCIDARDVFSVLRCSTKLQRDLTAQFELLRSRGGGSTAATAFRPSVRLSRFVEHHPGHCFRVFVENGTVLGVSQRAVDQVHEHLVMLTPSQHREQFNEIRRVVQRYLCGGMPNASAVTASIDAPCMLVDVIYEGGTLPVCVVGCTVVPSLALIGIATSAESIAARREFGAASSVSQLTVAVNDPLAFRLFRTYEGLRAFAFGEATAARLGEGDVNKPREEIAVARDHDDLTGDGKQFAGAGSLPVELAHPELFAMDQEMRDMLLRVMTQQQQQQQQ
jgi:hypothetical protein